MRSRKLFLTVCIAALVFSTLLTACGGGGGNSTATPGTGEEHSLPSAQAGYPAGGGNPTPVPGYPQP